MTTPVDAVGEDIKENPETLNQVNFKLFYDLCYNRDIFLVSIIITDLKYFGYQFSLDFRLRQALNYLINGYISLVWISV